jgi:restriction endonuclease S subunit
MATNKLRTTVGDYVTLVRGTTYQGNLVGAPGPALLGLGSIEPGGGFRVGHYKTYGGDCPAQLMLLPEDLYASLKGATKDGKMIGSVARIPQSVASGRLTQDTVKLVFREASQEDACFLYWMLRTPQYRDYCAGRAMGSAVVALSRHDFLTYPIPSPTSARRHISRLLDDIEARIEVNRLMNQTLEATARAIFKDWFVDFGPTRAKIERRAPYLSPEIWAPFPNEFDEEGKPAGWRERPLSALFSIIGGGTPKTSAHEYWGGEIPWFSVVDTPPSGSLFVVKTEKLITQAGLDQSSACLVPAGTTIISARGTVGNLAIAGQDMTFNQSCYGLRAAGSSGDCFVFLAAQHMVDRLRSMAHGSVFSTITRDTFDAILFPHADDKSLQNFEILVTPIFNKIRANVGETRTLLQTRDLLLPKLASGQIRVTKAEEIVVAA